MNVLSLRGKMLLLLLLLAVSVILSALFISSAEENITQQSRQDLLNQAKPLQALFEDKIEADAEFRNLLTGGSKSNVFPVSIAKNGITVDGFDDEWFDYEDSGKEIHNFGQDASIRLVKSKNYYFLSVVSEDDSIVYPKLNQANALSDKVVVNVGNQLLHLIPEAPGKVNAYRQTQFGLEVIGSIYGFWRESTTGFQLEVRIPIALMGKQFSAEIHDVDQQNNGQLLQGIYSFTRFETWPLNNLSKDTFWNAFEAKGQRLILVNADGEVLKSIGSTRTASSLSWLERKWLSLLDYRVSSYERALFLTPNDVLEGKRSLSNTWLDTALAGSITLSTIAREQVALNSTEHVFVPLHHSDKVIGVLILSSTSIAEKLLVRNLWVSIFTLFIIVWIIIFVMVLRQTKQHEARILALRDEAESIAMQHGVVTHPIALEEVHDDEIADLTNSFSILTHRLKDHHDYQQQLSARLNHELRTPIAIVKSSLDNLSLSELDADDKSLLNSAQEGTQRLSQTLSKLAEASRLEQIIKDTPKVPLNLCDLLHDLIGAYRLNWPNHKFELEQPKKSVVIQGDKALFAQMLDKVISNAVDFDNKQGPIRVVLEQAGTALQLSVRNYGPTLEKSDRKKMFYIMHSSRKSQQNLGLGLAVAKLIANFHGAQISATNVYNKGGVSINILWKNGVD